MTPHVEGAGADLHASPISHERKKKKNFSRGVVFVPFEEVHKMNSAKVGAHC
jgi:hypothetical protein